MRSEDAFVVKDTGYAESKLHCRVCGRLFDFEKQKQRWSKCKSQPRNTMQLNVNTSNWRVFTYNIINMHVFAFSDYKYGGYRKEWKEERKREKRK